jgi:UDP-N-acetylmuramoyl-L-alanyl-D-glutamate--2,6-diaminopimelate ligase
MKLARLIRETLGLRLSLPDTEVLQIVQDTRALEPGLPSVFVARRGGALDGHRFAAWAIAQGAVAVVGSATPEEQRSFPWYYAVPYIHVSDDRVALAKLAATLYGHPSRKLFCIGVTGTDGKTTTAYLLHHLLSGSCPTGLLSTAGVKIGNATLTLSGHFTTPEAPEVQRLLADCVEAGCTHVVVESSSHGFAQRRLDEVDYDVGVWTNLSPEHLDFHGTFSAYREAKAQLMARARVSVLNRDDPEYGYFAGRAARHVSYWPAEGATWRAADVREGPGMLSWTLEVPGPASRRPCRWWDVTTC